MAFLFGLVTFWFVFGGALFIKDSRAGKVDSVLDYVLWPLVAFRR